MLCIVSSIQYINHWVNIWVEWCFSEASQSICFWSFFNVRFGIRTHQICVILDSFVKKKNKVYNLKFVGSHLFSINKSLLSFSLRKFYLLSVFFHDIKFNYFDNTKPKEFYFHHTLNHQQKIINDESLSRFIFYTKIKIQFQVFKLNLNNIKA